LAVFEIHPSQLDYSQEDPAVELLPLYVCQKSRLVEMMEVGAEKQERFGLV
jgi:hypothetical protein